MPLLAWTTSGFSSALHGSYSPHTHPAHPFPSPQAKKLSDMFPTAPKDALDLLSKLLQVRRPPAPPPPARGRGVACRRRAL
jgi:hypothetical protein